VAGNAGSFTDFMHERYAASATEAGTYVSGQVGQVATGLTDATIFLIWDGFLVVQGNKIMSLVPNANPAIGIVSEYLNSRELVMGMVIDVDAQTRADAVAPLNCCYTNFARTARAPEGYWMRLSSEPVTTL